MKKKNPLNLTPSQRKWTRKLCDALESGEYKQCRDELRSGDRFCCLGVACDISKLSKWNRELYLGRSDLAPAHVVDLFGFEGAGGFILKIHGTIADMQEHNDYDRRRFPTIAKAIRQQVLGEKV